MQVVKIGKQRCQLCHSIIYHPNPEFNDIETIQNQGYYDKFFTEIGKLGRGHSGTVFLVRHTLDKVELGMFAIKCIPIGDQKPLLLKILKEVGLLQRLKHNNVIEYKHCWVEDRQINYFGPSVSCIFVLMELADGGNLEEFIYLSFESHERTRIHKTLHQDVDDEVVKKYGGILTEKGVKTRYLNKIQINKLFNDVVGGLEHLHSHGIIHCDLKPSNLLLQRVAKLQLQIFPQ